MGGTGVGVAAGVDVAVGGGGVAVGVLVGGIGVTVGVFVAAGVGTGVSMGTVGVLVGAGPSTACPPGRAPHPVKKTASTPTTRSLLFIYRTPTKMSTKAVIPQRRSGSCSASTIVTS
jgi:hypothetical protein